MNLRLSSLTSSAAHRRLIRSTFKNRLSVAQFTSTGPGRFESSSDLLTEIRGKRFRQERKPQLFLFAAKCFAVCAMIACLSHINPVPAQNVQRNNEAVDLGIRSSLTVNPATRAVELQIPLGHYPGRAGHDVPVTMSYSSKVWNMVYQGFASGPPPGHAGPAPFTILMAQYGNHSVSGWTSTNGFASIDQSPGFQLYDNFGHPRTTGDCNSGCYVIDRVLARMPDGSAHELRSSDQAIWYTDQRPDNLYSVDGSRMRYQRSTDTLFLPDGSRHVLSGSVGYFDRNGNKISGTDTLGRTIANPLAGVSPSTPVEKGYSLPGVGPTGTINYLFKWKHLEDVLTTAQPLAYVADSGCPSGTGSFSPTLFTSDINSRTCIQNAPQLFNPVVLAEIVLPAGQSYKFTYTQYGEIDKVMLPSGGYEKYTYAAVLPLSSSPWVYSQYNRGVINRVVSPTGSSADEQIWVYSGGLGYVKTVAPDGTWTERYAWQDGNSLWGFSADGARAGRAYDERVYSASNQMLRRKLTEWAMTGSNGVGISGLEYANRNARVTRETEFLFDTGGGGALARTVTYGYDLTYQFDVGIDQDTASQHDFVLVEQNTAQTIDITALSSIPTGTVLRTTKTSYLTSNANYRNRNIVGLVASTTIFKGPSSDNIVVGYTSTTYDEGGQFSQLNDYPSVVNWTDPQTPYRANPTTVSRWLNYNGSTFSSFPSGAYLANHMRYDQCGNVRTTWDARDTGLTNPAQIIYSDSFSDGVARATYAFPTATTSSIPDPSGLAGSNVGLTTTSVYDFHTGKVISTTDPNGKTTSYDYTDPLGRLKQVTFPDTGRVRYAYFNTPGDSYIQALSDLDASRSIETRQYYDGLGRATRAFRYDGTPSTPWLVTDTYYDVAGRVEKVSNSYRVTTPSAVLPTNCSICTTTTYDALGRAHIVTTPDNAQVVSDYGASTDGTLATAITVTDQAGNQRRSLTDVLGRLVRIDEPDKDSGSLGTLSSPVQPTTYTYDLLDNLRIVTQGSQQRFFLYDSLSRLLALRQPEQATIANWTLSDPLFENATWSLKYSYDNNGNLSERKDARGVTANYGYDALNRSTTIDYSNDPSGTPRISRRYDGANNGKGLLWKSEAVTGTSPNLKGTRTTNATYDVVGRPKQLQQQFFAIDNANPANAYDVTYAVQREYNLAGNVISQTYPSGHLVHYSYDSAGRLNNNGNSLAFTGNLGDGVERTYASHQSYAPAGELEEEKFGSVTPIYHKLRYNSRRQLTEILASTSGGNNQSDQGRILNDYSLQCSGTSCNATDNNGNIRKQSVEVPSYQGGTASWYQKYDYDHLNRLVRVHEYTGNTLYDSQQEYSYDRWGGRKIESASNKTWGLGINNKNFELDPATNRLYAPGDLSLPDVQRQMRYDAAGNQTKDTYSGSVLAENRTYDAENRLTSQTQGGVVAETYSYGAGGHRIKRKINGAETWQVYGFDGDLLAEYQAGAYAFIPQKEYGYRSGALLVTATNNDADRVTRYIKGLYYSALGRGATALETGTALNSLGAAVNANDMVALVQSLGMQLFESQEYIDRNRTDAEFITDLYFSYYQRAPDAANMASGLDQLNRYERFAVRETIAGNAEAVGLAQRLFGAGVDQDVQAGLFIDGLYLGALSRYPNASERSSLVARLNESAADTAAVQTTASDIAIETFESDEYVERNRTKAENISDLFAALLQREQGNEVVSFPFNSTPSQRLTIMLTRPEFEAITGAIYREVFWLIPDQLGTPRMIVDRSGTYIRRQDYLPFGEELTGQPQRSTFHGYTSPNGVRQRFSKKERDIETGLDYFKARYYSSLQGRFITPDPLRASGVATEPQSWNRYAYTLNNPLKYIDATGLIWGTYQSDGVTHIRWYENEQAMTEGGASLYTGPLIYQSANGYVSLDPHSNRWEVNSSEWEAKKAYWRFTGLESSWIDFVPVFGQFRRFIFNWGVGNYEAALGNFAMASVEGGTSGFGRAISGTASVGSKSISVASGMGGEAAEMTVVRVIQRGEKIADIVNEGKALTLLTSNEHAVVTLASGERALVSGGQYGIRFVPGQVKRIFGHSHPYHLNPTGPSADDFNALQQLGQRSSWLFERGQMTKFTIPK